MTPFILVNNVLQYLSYKPGGPIGMPVPPQRRRVSRRPRRARWRRASARVSPSPRPGPDRPADLGLFGVGTMIGLVLGGIAICSATKQPAEYGGRGIAIGGVIVNAANGATAVVLVVMIVAGQPTPHPPRCWRDRSRSPALASSCSTARLPGEHSRREGSLPSGTAASWRAFPGGHVHGGRLWKAVLGRQVPRTASAGRAGICSFTPALRSY